MKKIICFGDSNTWGYDPSGGWRYPKNVRWTGRLSELLGGGYQIVEEGENGRTIAYPAPWEWGLNAGIEYVLPMLELHAPADLLIIMLGTNDLNARQSLSSAAVAESLRGMLALIRDYQGTHPDSADMKILIAAPPAIGDGIAFSPFAPLFDVHTVARRAKELAACFESVAKQCGCYFLNTSGAVSGGRIDSVHLSPEGHAALAGMIAEKVKEIFSGQEESGLR